MRGSQPFQPTPEQRKMVEMLSAMGVPHEDICKLIIGPRGNPKDDKTLRKHFRTELDTAAIKANQQVAGALFKAATNPNGGSSAVTAAIFWLKTRARWKETSAIELSGPDGGPVSKIEWEIVDHTPDKDSAGIPAPAPAVKV